MSVTDIIRELPKLTREDAYAIASTGAAEGAVGLNATEPTALGWPKFRVGASEATFHVRTALSAPV